MTDLVPNGVNDAEGGGGPPDHLHVAPESPRVAVLVVHAREEEGVEPDLGTQERPLSRGVAEWVEVPTNARSAPELSLQKRLSKRRLVQHCAVMCGTRVMLGPPAVHEHELSICHKPFHECPLGVGGAAVSVPSLKESLLAHGPLTIRIQSQLSDLLKNVDIHNGIDL